MEESLKLFGQIRHFRGWAQSLRGLCQVFAGLGEMATAFKAVDQLISEAHKAGEWGEQAGALMQKGQMLVRQGRFDEALAAMKDGQAAFAKAGSAAGQAHALESQGRARQQQGQPAEARAFFQRAAEAYAQCGSREGEARLAVRLGDLDASQIGGDGGEASYKRALILSRQHKMGDYSLGALLGMAGMLFGRGRILDALNLGVLCARCLEEGLMPVSEEGFNEELFQKAADLMGQLGSRLMRNVLEEAGVRVASEDARKLLKESLETYGA